MSAMPFEKVSANAIKLYKLGLAKTFGGGIKVAETSRAPTYLFTNTSTFIELSVEPTS